MRIFSGFFGLIVLVGCVVFALSNVQAVPVALWPIKEPFQVPLFAVALIPCAVGFVLGTFGGWVGGFKHKREVKSLKKQLKSLSGKATELQSAATVTPLKPKSFWSRT